MVSAGDSENLKDDTSGKMKGAAPPLFKKRVAAGKNYRRRGRAEDSNSRKAPSSGESRAAGASSAPTEKDIPSANLDLEREAGNGSNGPGGGTGKNDKATAGVPARAVGEGSSREDKEAKEAKDGGHTGDDEDDDEDNDDDDGARMGILADLREEQRSRRKGGGRSVSALMGTGKKDGEDPLVIKGQGVDGVGSSGAVATETEGFGLKTEPKAQNISTMIQSQFKSGGTGGWGAGNDSSGAVAHEQLMEQYVKEKMGGDAAVVAAPGSEGADETGNGATVSEEDRLYHIPEEFKRKVQEAKREFDTGANRTGEMEGEVGSGAQIAWNTGIAEIALPIEFKLKNMEDTLQARDKMEQDRAARRNAPGESSEVTGSLTANYSHHQREWASQIRALQQRQAMAEESQLKAATKSGPGIAASMSVAHSGSGSAGGTGGGGGRGAGDGTFVGPGGVKIKHSTDNAVLERFKKRTRRF